MQKHDPSSVEAQTASLPLYVPIAQLAALLGMPYSTVAHHVRDGVIPSTRFNERGRRYVHRVVVRELLQRGAA
jgi:electron transfer flavoprotein alpha/beta subunit